MRNRYFILILAASTFLGVISAKFSVAEETSPVTPAATDAASADSTQSAAAKLDSVAAPVQSESNTNPSAPAPVAAVPETPKVSGSYPASTNTLQLSEEQEKKLREILARQKVVTSKKKHEKEMLDKSPVLDKTLNPNITERGAIPNRF